jgi:ABC-type uncharacterized transport system involved in gliding motility auxiliary subunit
MKWLQRLNERLLPLLLLALLILLAWFSQRFQFYWDWTRQGGNSLSETSVAVLERTPGPLEVTAFAPQLPALRANISHFIERYQRVKPDLSLRFVDPSRHPDEARRQGISLSGELLLSYNGREERLQRLDEQRLTQAIQRLNRQTEYWLAGLSGHGERDLLGQANHDLGQFGKALQQQGYRITVVDLVTTPQLPDNTSLLILASPQRALLAGELQQLRDYLDTGRNLLLLTDPTEPAINQPLLDLFGLEALPGTVVDANVSQLGIDNPAVALVPRYPAHAATEGFSLLSLFPQAAALQLATPTDWQPFPLLQTLDRSWNETGALSGEIERDPARNEQPGPLTIGFALTRNRADDEQRVVVIGDGDFLANSYLNNQGNLDLGLALVRWLAADQQMIGIPARHPADRQLQLSSQSMTILGLGWLIGAPLLLLLTGALITWRRRRA